MSSVTPENGNAPTLGDLVEKWATERFPFEYADEDFFDHIGQSGTKIQVKGAKAWIKNGYNNGNQSYTRGRWKFYEGDHEQLVENDGVYLLIVYDADDPDDLDDLDILAWKIVGPDVVEEAIDEWWDTTDIRCSAKGQTRRLSWLDILEDEKVDDDDVR